MQDSGRTENSVETVPHSVRSPTAKNDHHDSGGSSVGNGNGCVLPGVGAEAVRITMACQQSHKKFAYILLAT